MLAQNNTALRRFSTGANHTHEQYSARRGENTFSQSHPYRMVYFGNNGADGGGDFTVAGCTPTVIFNQSHQRNSVFFFLICLIFGYSDALAQ